MAQWRRRHDDDQSYGPGSHDDRGYDMADWYWDVNDYYHAYETDWYDRFDDAEGSMRNAFSSLFGNRRGRRRSIEDRPPRALRQGVHTKDILKEAGFFEIMGKVEELTKKIEALTKKA